MTDSDQNKKNVIAFALGGLAGNNAHGAGFLQAALDSRTIPDMISCTSGQIYWVYMYLNELNQQRNGSFENTRSLDDHLRTILMEDIQESPTGTLGTLDRILRGRPGKIVPDFNSFYNEFAMNSWSLIFKSMSHPMEVDPISDIMHLIPSRWLSPVFPEEFYRKISDAFNAEARIGIFFNSYNPTGGYETVYVNPTARKAIQFKNRKKGRAVMYAEITPQAIKDALRLYDYGFDRETDQNVDGEYFRPIILRELLSANAIYVVKPVNSKWIGNLPTSKVELEDLKTEMGINAIYMAEKANIDLINVLIAKGHLTQDSPYHPVAIHEVEIQSNEGFDDYAVEDINIFDAAKDMAEKLLRV